MLSITSFKSSSESYLYIDKTSDNLNFSKKQIFPEQKIINSFLCDSRNAKSVLTDSEKNCNFILPSTFKKIDAYKYPDLPSESLEENNLESGDISRYREVDQPQNIFESGEKSIYREELEELMLKLGDAIRGGDRLAARTFLVELLENEGTKSIPSTDLKNYFECMALLAKSKDRPVKVSNFIYGEALEKAKDWSKFSELLKFIVQEQPIGDDVIHNDCSIKIWGHRNSTKDTIKEGKSSSRASLTEYPNFPIYDGYISLEMKFLSAIKENLKEKKINKKVIKALVLAYPLFTDETKLTTFLNDFENKHKGFVSKFIKELEKSKRAHVASTGAEVSSVYVNVTSVDWIKWGAMEFANAFAIRDSRLINAIDFSDIRKWLEGKAEQPESVAILEKTYKTTLQWMVYEIISELDNNKRLNILNKFLNIGTVLLENDYFHSASQIAHVLIDPAVESLLPIQYRSNSNYSELVKLTQPGYVSLNNPSGREVGNTLFPIDHEFWKELQTVNNCLLNRYELAGLVKHAQALNNYRRVSSDQQYLKNNPIYSFVSHLQPVPFKALDGLSHFFYKMQCDDPHPEVKLADWNSAKLVQLLLIERIDPVTQNNFYDLSLLKKMFNQGVYTGKQLIERYSKNKKLIEVWPLSMQLTFLEAYISHLSSNLYK